MCGKNRLEALRVVMAINESTKLGTLKCRFILKESAKHKSEGEPGTGVGSLAH